MLAIGAITLHAATGGTDHLVPIKMAQAATPILKPAPARTQRGKERLYLYNLDRPADRA
jgi:hypothetical protein